MPSVPDPYGTAALRERVLDAWRASPARFREDANAEEDQALGGYRDRLVVELAQNAADAAGRAGVPGRLLLRLDEQALRAANTGAPLDAAGVESLSTLRASAKRDGTGVGRFGVGFAAVLAVSDEPRIASHDGAVGWSRTATRDAVRADAALAGELDRRDGHVPVLRLPSPAACPSDGPPEGYDTEVVLPLRDPGAYAFAHRLLGEAGPALLLALPALAEVVIEVDGVRRELRAERSADGTEVTVDDGGAVDRWRLAAATGALDAALLADRPVEERAHAAWTLTWAVPVDGDDRPRPLPASVTAVVHAPTPSDEPLDLPALLLASFPLDPARRHVAPGPLTDLLVERAARAYAGLVAALPAGPDLLDLVPGPVPAGALDASVREAIVRELGRTPFLPVAEDDAVRVRPPDAVAADAAPGLVAVLAEVLPGLLPVGWAPRRTPLARLGVRRLALADVVDLLAALDRPPPWWRRLYAELAGTDPEALGALPVPLADGRTVRGARGVLVPVAGLDLAPLAGLGVRVVDADATHPLLLRLGAVEGTPRALLDDPHVRAAVAHSYDAEGPDAVADAVLPVVRAATSEPGEEPWLGALALRDEDGEVRPADELLLPDGPLAAVMADDAPFGLVAAELVERWGAETLERAGVLATFAVARDEDVPLDAGCDHDLDGEDDWVAATTVSAGVDQDADLPAVVAEFAAVRDLDLVDPASWDEALDLLTRPPLRAVLTEPAAVLTPNGRRVLLPSYTAWWLRTRPVLGGRRPVDVRSGDPLLAGLYDAPPAGTSPDLLAALGVRSGLAGLLAEPGGPAELLSRLADPARTVGVTALGGLYAALAGVPPEHVDPPPERVRVVAGTATRVADAADAVVLDAPDLLPLLGSRPYVAVRHDRAEALAAVLDLPLASEEVAGPVTSAGDREPVPAVVREVLPDAPEAYVLHDPLVVVGAAGGVEVAWRYAGGELHAVSAAGLARGLAWAAGRWEARHLLAAVLGDPDAAPTLLAEAALDAPGP